MRWVLKEHGCIHGRRWLWMIVACLGPLAVFGQSEAGSFKYVPCELGVPVQRPGMFVGRSNGALIAGGGEQDGAPVLDAYVRPEGASAWQRFTLPAPLVNAACVTASIQDGGKVVTRLIAAGGPGTPPSDRIQVLEWLEGALKVSELPPLPVALSGAGLGVFEDQPERQLYVVGGETAAGYSRRVFRHTFGSPTAGWEELPPMPGPGRLAPGVICLYNDLHVFGGYTAPDSATDRCAAFRWKAIDGTRMTGWRELAPLPEALGGVAVFQTGPVHTGVTGGRARAADAANDDIFLYHNVTDTWVNKGKLGVGAGFTAERVIPGAAAFLLVGGAKSGGITSFDMTLLRTVKSLGGWDYFFLAGYFILVAWAGIWFAHKQKSTSSYALGDRKVPWWMAGISMFATGASSISFMAIPAQSFRTNLLWAFPVLLLIPLFFLEAYVIYPLIRKLSLTSTFEYLERRFHPSLRMIASAQCIALQTFGRMNMVLLLPALAIAAVTGLRVEYSVLLMGVVTTIYTAKGGLKAVIMTEVVQGITMLVGVSLIIGLAITGLRGGFHDFVEIGTRFGKFDYANWSFDYTAPVFWMIILTPILGKFAFASDQPVVQRVFATPLKDVRKLAGMFLVCSVFISLAVNVAGIAVFAYFHQHPAQLDPAMTNDQVIPLYIVQRLPVGVAGLIIAALFAAAASALAGSMNSVATVFAEDFYLKMRPTASDREALITMRVVSILSGVLATACAIYMARMNMRSLFQTWNELMALLGGGFAGIFILGIFTHRANTIGAMTGALSSIVVAVLVKQYTALHWYGYMPAAVLSCVVIGYLVSLVTPGRANNLAGLTMFDINRGLDDGEKK